MQVTCRLYEDRVESKSESEFPWRPTQTPRRRQCGDPWRSLWMGKRIHKSDRKWYITRFVFYEQSCQRLGEPLSRIRSSPNLIPVGTVRSEPGLCTVTARTNTAIYNSAPHNLPFVQLTGFLGSLLSPLQLSLPTETRGRLNSWGDRPVGFMNRN